MLTAPPEAPRDELEHALAREAGSVRVASSVESARALLKEAPACLVLVDVRLAGGAGFLGELRESAGTQAILLLDADRIDDAARSLQLGAREMLQTPVRPEDLHARLAETRRRVRFLGELGLLKLGLATSSRFGSLVGTSPAMLRVYDLVARASQSDSTVLLTGESGTGKELVARTLHDLSSRAGRPFLAINCGAVLPGLIDAELFGHEKGSFTGADRAHSGIFARASGGTILLDEIADMPMELQVKLLRTLETRAVMPVGGERDVAVDVRIIAATNRIPEEAVAENKLREDLYYRLRVLRIHLPPLRDRAGDVRILSREFLDELNRRSGTSKTIAPEGVTALEAGSWPGNVRELRNTMEEAFILADRRIDTVTLARMAAAGPAPGEVGGVSGAAAVAAMRGSEADGDWIRLHPGQCTLAEAEQQLVLATLAACGGNRTRAARALGIDPKTLYNRLLSYER